MPPLPATKAISNFFIGDSLSSSSRLPTAKDRVACCLKQLIRRGNQNREGSEFRYRVSRHARRILSPTAHLEPWSQARTRLPEKI